MLLKLRLSSEAGFHFSAYLKSFAQAGALSLEEHPWDVQRFLNPAQDVLP